MFIVKNAKIVSINNLKFSSPLSQSPDMKTKYLLLLLLRFGLLVLLFSFLSAPLFSQKNVAKFDWISLSKVSLKYERSLIFNSSIAIGYRNDYKIYDLNPINIFTERSYSYKRKGHQLSFDLRWYLFGEEGLGFGLYLGYHYMIGRNKLEYIEKTEINQYKVISHSRGIDLGFSFHIPEFENGDLYIETGMTLSRNALLKGNENYRFSNEIGLRPDLIGRSVDLYIGVGYLF